MASNDSNREMKQRRFAYSAVFRHPPLAGPAFDSNGIARPGLDPAVATLCKNESNCTVFLEDGTWFTTWSQGSYEHAVDEHIVFSTSRDMGKTWTQPTTIIASSDSERISYGVPFVVPRTQRIYLFFHAGCRAKWEEPEYDAGLLNFIYSEDRGASWSQRYPIPLPPRDIDMFPGRLHGWLNHPPQIMPTGEVILPISAYDRGGYSRRAWMLAPAEVSAVRCDNILMETDPKKLRFTLLPEGPRGIRVDVFRHRDNPALNRLLKLFHGFPEQSGFNFQEMTVVSLDNGCWLGVGRTFLGSPGYTLTEDHGLTWTPVEPLCYGPDAEPIKHPMTMCPIAKTTDGRIVLLFTNNDGSQRGAKHVWDGNGRTRNPQWIVVGRQIPSQRRNAGVVFGEPMILAEVDDSGETNLKTGVSMPQFFENNGRYFVCYNINKEHIVLDEIPAIVLDQLTPAECHCSH